MINQCLPWFARIVKWRFRIPDERWRNVVMAYGSSVYTRVPEVEKEVVVHECVHLDRQRNSKLYGLWWWLKYLVSPRFRFLEELVAYRRQYQWVCENRPRFRDHWLHKCAGDLSSETYGSLISFEEAKKLIQE